MLNHFITLQSLAEEFHRELKDGIINEIFTQQKNELIISIDVKHSPKSLVASINPQMNFIFMREQVARAKRNSVDIFREIFGHKIKKISSHLYERIIRIYIDNGYQIVFNMFSSAASNVFLIDETEQIISAFKNSKEHSGKSYIEVSKRKEETSYKFMSDYGTFEQLLLEDKHKTIFSALKAIYPFLGSTFTREALHRSGVEDKIHTGDLTRDDCKIIFQKLKDIFIESSRPSPTIYYSNNIPRVVSMIKLQHLGGSQSDDFSSVNDAVKTFIIKSLKMHDIDTEKKELLIKLRNELDRARRSEKAISTELNESSRADNYGHIAKVIMANLQHLTKGTKEIDIEDVFHNDQLMHITLDPKLTPPQNAERYFDKSRKARAAYQSAVKRYDDVKNNIAFLEKLLLHLDNCLTKDQLSEFKEEYESDLRKMHIITSKSKYELPPFRIFKVAGGFEVWVGKNAANNNLLTMKYAKPNDLWFHARGASGSHVVLKVGSGKTKPGKEAVKQAASIAAYYSKMRNASNVPVGYCERKYLRKPKKGPDGTVVMEREKIIFVDPELPDTTD